MQYFVIIFDCPPDYMEARKPFFEAHRAYVDAAIAAGSLIFGGGLKGEPSQGMLFYRCKDQAAAEAFTINHPYVVGGLVTWRVREWLASSVSPMLMETAPEG